MQRYHCQRLQFTLLYVPKYDCEDMFILCQVGETEPFVCELLKGLPTTILDLEAHQIHTFYEAVCWTDNHSSCLI